MQAAKAPIRMTEFYFQTPRSRRGPDDASTASHEMCFHCAKPGMRFIIPDELCFPRNANGATASHRLMEAKPRGEADLLHLPSSGCLSHGLGNIRKAKESAAVLRERPVHLLHGSRNAPPIEASCDPLPCSDKCWNGNITPCS